MSKRKKNDVQADQPSELTATTESSENALGGNSKGVSSKDRYIGRAEFENAIRALQNQIEAIQGAHPRQHGLELAPRPPVHHKRKSGRRHKLASTIDDALYDRIRELEAQGYQLGHLIDSAFRVLFQRPKLSFEIETPDETKKH